MTTSRTVRAALVNTACVLVSLAALAFILPAAFGLQRYVIAGGSMTGTIDLGSIAYEKVVPVSDLAVGDIITYMPPADSGIDHLVTHRIVSIRGAELRTRGDANADVDPWTFRLTSATQPRVAFHVPYAGYPLLALQHRGTRMLLIGVPAGLVFLLAFGELLGLRRRSVGQPGEQPEPAPVQGPVLKVLVPAQPNPADTDVASPRLRHRLSRRRDMEALK